MIIRIFSSTLPTFKELHFHEGLNVLLAEKSEGATSRQTRNAVGKSSMVEIVHFLMGADCPKDSLFRCNDLVEHRFGLEFILKNSSVEVERTCSNPSRVIVNNADMSDWAIKAKEDRQTGENIISNSKWREVLGKLIFNIPIDLPRFSPTFRSLFSYFARRVEAGAFMNPVQQYKNQQDWDYQVAISYILGLDWDIPREIEEIRQRESSLKTLRKELKTGVMETIMGSAATLKSKLTVADRKFKKLREQISTFQVLPEYRDLEREASELVVRISELSNENTIDEETVLELEAAIQDEKPPKLIDVRKMYEEAGIVLPETTIKRIEDVEKFHIAIVSNRRSHLQGEIESALQRVKQRQLEMERIDNRRREIMEILNTHGALDQFNKLQQEVNRVQAEVEELRKRHEIAEKVETTGADLSIERKQLHKRLMDDHKEQSEIIEEAIITFEDLSSELSEREGSLTIDPTERGPVFDVRIEARRSRGISSMQIFCFDMMLTILSQKKEIGPGFLIHDSHLFDGMDTRQIAKALEIGARTADQNNFQYIVSMNSDMVPYPEFNTEFEFKKYLLPITLTDATEDGGLFGFRFE